MKLLLFALLYVNSILLSAQTEIGIGIISIQFEENAVIQFYAHPKDEHPARTLEIFYDSTIYSLNIKKMDDQHEWLEPETYWSDYSIFTLRCTDLENGWFKVITNNTTGKGYWLKKNSLTEFETWESYLKGMFSLGRLANHPQNIKKLPSDSAKNVKYEGDDCFQLKSMNCDWIQIFTPDFCQDGYTNSKDKFESGWIRWKNGNILLIEYFITS